MSAIEFTEEQLTAAIGSLDVDALANGIANRHGTTWPAMRSPTRLAHIVVARRELYIALRAYGWSYPAIGQFVGGRDHTTVMHAVKGRNDLLWATTATNTPAQDAKEVA